MKDVIKPVAKSLLIVLEITAAAATLDAGIHKKLLDLKLVHQPFPRKNGTISRKQLNLLKRLICG